VQDLKAKGHSQARISRELRPDPRTVHRYMSAVTAEDQLNRAVGCSDLLADFKPYLISRMNEGCTHAGRLHEEIQALGWRGSVCPPVHLPGPCSGSDPGNRAGAAQGPPHDPVDPHRSGASRRTDGLALNAVRSRCEHLDAVAKRVGEFAVMMRDLTGEDLPAWLDRVQADDLRHCSYKGLAKAHVQHVLTAAGTNIIRLSQYDSPEDHPRPARRTSRLKQLCDRLADDTVT
jgi:hypothetical protein